MKLCFNSIHDDFHNEWKAKRTNIQEYMQMSFYVFKKYNCTKEEKKKERKKKKKKKEKKKREREKKRENKTGSKTKQIKANNNNKQ